MFSLRDGAAQCLTGAWHGRPSEGLYQLDCCPLCAAQILQPGDGQEILACCSQWGGKGSDMTAPERQRPSFSATLTHGGGIPQEQAHTLGTAPDSQ